jgi:hypothetical protein
MDDKGMKWLLIQVFRNRVFHFLKCKQNPTLYLTWAANGIWGLAMVASVIHEWRWITLNQILLLGFVELALPAPVSHPHSWETCQLTMWNTHPSMAWKDEYTMQLKRVGYRCWQYLLRWAKSSLSTRKTEVKKIDYLLLSYKSIFIFITWSIFKLQKWHIPLWDPWVKYNFTPPVACTIKIFWRL